jgi:hypothetical protein
MCNSCKLFAFFDGLNLSHQIWNSSLLFAHSKGFTGLLYAEDVLIVNLLVLMKKNMQSSSGSDIGSAEQVSEVPFHEPCRDGC